MNIEIRTVAIDRLRRTYSHIHRQTVSEHQEASFNIEVQTNLHYPPLWQPDKVPNDLTRTTVRMTALLQGQRSDAVLLQLLRTDPCQDTATSMPARHRKTAFKEKPRYFLPSCLISQKTIASRKFRPIPIRKSMSLLAYISTVCAYPVVRGNTRQRLITKKMRA